MAIVGRIVRYISVPILILAANAAIAQPVDTLERDDNLALSIAWRLQVANAAYCARAVPMTGIQLEDTAVYDDPAAVRRIYGLSGDIYVGALAENGPGATAGLAVNTTVIAIDGHPLSAIPAPTDRAPFDRLAQAQALLDDAAERQSTVTLTRSDGRIVSVAPVRACHVLVRIDDGKNYAKAVRDEIRLGRRFFDKANGNTDVLAGMISHEMAHAVLDHQALLARSHKSTSVTRRTEHEADRLSVWLLANAGFRPEAAIDFQRSIIAPTNTFLTVDPTHGGWRERVRTIEREIIVLKSAPGADWAHRFQRETPDL